MSSLRPGTRRAVGDGDRPCRDPRRRGADRRDPAADRPPRWRDERARATVTCSRESLRGPIGVSTAVTASALLAMAAFAGPPSDAGRWRGGRPWLARWPSPASPSRGTRGRRSRSPRWSPSTSSTWRPGHCGWAASPAWWCRSGPAPSPVRSPGRWCGSAAIAVVAVLVVVGAGLAMALIVLPALDDLVTTGYGLALLTKVALVIPVIAMGAYNRRRLVPHDERRCCRRAGAAAGPDRARRAGDPARRRRRDGRAGRPLSRSPRRRHRLTW